MSSLTRKCLLGAALLVALVIPTWILIVPKPARPHPPEPPVEMIPPGIVVTETSTIVPPPPPSGGSAPGDRALTDYGTSGSPQSDLALLSNTLTNFLTVSKQANIRPLSANEEWSAALRGRRPGSEVWISDHHRILDSQKRLIDRWGTPLHFHALGGQKWELRSSGPDQKLWTEDDLMEPLPRSSGTD